MLCFQCAKVCPHDNIGFGIATAEAGSRRQQLLRPVEAGFVMIAAGFVSHEVAGEVKWLDALFHRIPTALHRVWPHIEFGWFEVLWFLVVFPALFWMLVAAGARLAGHRQRPGTLLLAAATGAAPVVALAHFAKALAKVGNWGGYLPLALQDPRGTMTLEALARAPLTAPAALWGLPVLGWLLLTGMAVIGWRAMARFRRHPERDHVPALRVGFTGATVLYAAVLGAWLRG